MKLTLTVGAHPCEDPTPFPMYHSAIKFNDGEHTYVYTHEEVFIHAFEAFRTAQSALASIAITITADLKYHGYWLSHGEHHAPPMTEDYDTRECWIDRMNGDYYVAACSLPG